MTSVVEGRLVEMRTTKVVALQDDVDGSAFYVVLDEVAGGRKLVIRIGPAEALDISAGLGGLDHARPMAPHFAAGLLDALGGNVRRITIDRLVDIDRWGRAYAATVDVDGPLGSSTVDARTSDALNLALVVSSPVFAAVDVLEEAAARRTGYSPEAKLLRRALEAEPTRLVRQRR
jgi:bifunctional DNase/RNase